MGNGSIRNAPNANDTASNGYGQHADTLNANVPDALSFRPKSNLDAVKLRKHCTSKTLIVSEPWIKHSNA